MSKKVMLKSSDGESFKIDEAVALHSQTIAHMVEDGCADDEIPLANVKGSILSMVIEYCKKHVNSDSSSDESKKELKKWDADFMKMDLSVVFDVMLAANYLNIKTLLHLTCQTVADVIPGKTPDEIRAHFNIAKDLTDEEEAEIRRGNQWAFE